MSGRERWLVGFDHVTRAVFADLLIGFRELVQYRMDLIFTRESRCSLSKLMMETQNQFIRYYTILLLHLYLLTSNTLFIVSFQVSVVKAVKFIYIKIRAWFVVANFRAPLSRRAFRSEAENHETNCNTWSRPNTCPEFRQGKKRRKRKRNRIDWTGGNYLFRPRSKDFLQPFRFAK